MIILKDDKIDPDILKKIDRKNSIIICTPSTILNDVASTIEPDIFTINLTRDINISNITSIISQHLVSIDYMPTIKIFIPSGLMLNFNELKTGNFTNLFNKIYKDVSIYSGYFGNYEKEVPDYFIYEDFVFTLYIDTIQMRKKLTSMYLKKDEPLIEFSFSWYIQTQIEIPQIKDIYIIKNLECYQNFKNII